MHFESIGDNVPGHVHDFAHAMICIKGSATVRYRLPMEEILDEKIIKVGDYFNMEARIEHDLIALENDTLIVCVHPERPGKTWLEAIR